MSTARMSMPVRAAALAWLLFAAVCVAGCGSSAKRPTSSAVTWPAPVLRDPTVIDLTSTTPSYLNLDPHRDYVLRLPRDHAVNVPYGFTVNGGHDVVMVGGTLNITKPSGVMTLQDQTGTVHIEGVRFTGPDLLEGFDLSESAGAVVEFEHLYVATVHGSQHTNHADLIQTWAGPRQLLVDGFVGSTQYQGFFLLPNQHYAGPPPERFDLRNVYIDDQGGYALWLQSQPRVPVSVSNVYVTPNPTKPDRTWWLMPNPGLDAVWSQVRSVNALPSSLASVARTAGTRYR